MGWFMYKENSGEGYIKNEKQLLPFVKKIIYLAALGLSFGTQGLHSIFTTAYGIQFPDQG